MEQQPFFSLPFSNAIVPDRKGSFFHVVAVSSLHRRSTVERASSVTRASSIVVIAEVAKPPPLSSFNLACRYVLLLFQIVKLFYGFWTSMCVSKSRFGSRWLVVGCFRSDMIVKRGCSTSPARWMKASWRCSGVMRWSKMVVTTHWRHLGFEWWLGFLIWEKVEDDDVAHCDWCRCVYKDHGYVWCCYWVRKYFFFLNLRCTLGLGSL